MRNQRLYFLDLAGDHEHKYLLPSERSTFTENKIRQIIAKSKCKSRYEQLEKIIYHLSELQKDPSKFDLWNNRYVDEEKQIALFCLTSTPHWAGNDIGRLSLHEHFFNGERVTINVWLPKIKGEAGHVSIETHSGVLNKNGVYISLWPDKTIDFKHMHRFFFDQKAVLRSKEEDLYMEQRPPDVVKSFSMFNPWLFEAYYTSISFLIKTGRCKFNLSSDMLSIIDIFSGESYLDTAVRGFYIAQRDQDFDLGLQALKLFSEDITFNCTTLIRIILKASNLAQNFNSGLIKINGLPESANNYYQRAISKLKKLHSIKVWTPSSIAELLYFLEAKEKYLQHTFRYFVSEEFHGLHHLNSKFWNNISEEVNKKINCNNSADSPEKPEFEESSTLSSKNTCMIV